MTTTRRLLTMAIVLATIAVPATAHAQLWNFVSLEKVNAGLGGRIDDYTHNHGEDRRICSPILGMRRDLYVYTPPGYDPAIAYPLIVYFHSADFDEHVLLGGGFIEELDAMILRGESPPVVVACPDGTYSGENRLRAHHSLFVNGLGGRVEDHLMREVLPFVMQRYSILPGREAHAVLGASAGGYGALGLAIKHRDFFGASATLASPINMRYSNVDGEYGQQFDPATYRWLTEYDPSTVVAVFYAGLQRVRARRVLVPVYGRGPDALPAIARDNPADLLFTSGLRPGELAIYLHFGAKDEYNFDSHNLSFAWLASSQGIAVAVACDPDGRHNLKYFKAHHRDAFRWLAGQLTPPAAPSR